MKKKKKFIKLQPGDLLIDRDYQIYYILEIYRSPFDDKLSIKSKINNRFDFDKIETIVKLIKGGYFNHIPVTKNEKEKN